MVLRVCVLPVRIRAGWYVCVCACSYVEIAVRVASRPELRAALRARVLQNAHKLFHQDDSVQAWQDTLERLATKAIGSTADATGK